MKKVLFVWPNRDQWGFKPIGISLLSAVAKEAGCETLLFDTTHIDFGVSDNTETGEMLKTFKPVDTAGYDLTKKKLCLKKEFSKCFESFKPDIVAISVLSDEHKLAQKISRYAKEHDKKAVVLWGGKYATLNPEKSLEIGADYVCVGEGVTPFKHFILAQIYGVWSVDAIIGIWSKNNSTGFAPLVDLNIDGLPYLDWDVFDKRHFVKLYDGKVVVGGDYMSNWGCVNKCSYCINQYYHKMYEGKYLVRRFSNLRAIQELIHLKDKHGLTFLKFHDEDFFLRPTPVLEEFCRMYKEVVSLPFVMMTHPKTVSEAKVLMVKDAGCVSVSIGIETGDPELRKDVLNRTDTPQEVINAVKLFNKHGIRTSSFNMLGIPGETRETYFSTVKLNRDAKVQYPNIGFFFPFEHTPLHDVSVKQGLFNPKDGLVYQHNVAALTFPNLSNSELVEMRNCFNLYVKLPKKYHLYIGRSETQDRAGMNLRKKLLKIYDNTVLSNDGWYKSDGVDYMKELRRRKP